MGLILGLARTTPAEVVYLKNGDVLHGTLVAVGARRITLQTEYGRVVIPKRDVVKIVFEDEGEPQGEEKPAAGPPKPLKPDRAVARPTPSRALLSVDIRGRSFWYAWHSERDQEADPRIRLRFYLGEIQAAEILDSKPDTVDKSDVYNSFTFSPSDSQVVGSGQGFTCAVREAKDGRVVLSLELPESHPEGAQTVRMVYQVNEGTRDLPQWIDAVSRSFEVQVKPGKETYVVLEQSSEGLDYSGLFRKKMRNLETFEVKLLNSELRERAPEPRGS